MYIYSFTIDLLFHPSTDADTGGRRRRRDWFLRFSAVSRNFSGFWNVLKHAKKREIARSRWQRAISRRWAGKTKRKKRGIKRRRELVERNSSNGKEVRWRVYACSFRCAHSTATYDLSTKIKSPDINLVVSEAHLNFCSTQTYRPSSPCPPRSFHLSLHRPPPVGTFVIPFRFSGCTTSFYLVYHRKRALLANQLGLEPLPEPASSLLRVPLRGVRVDGVHSAWNPRGELLFRGNLAATPTTLFSLSSSR